jgi:hypothetical protein
MNETEIILEIETFIKLWGAPYASFYVGISGLPIRRLFRDHKVDPAVKTWAYFPASSVQAARAAEVYFTEVLKTDGGFSSEDKEADSVYVFKKTQSTDPPV